MRLFFARLFAHPIAFVSACVLAFWSVVALLAVCVPAWQHVPIVLSARLQPPSCAYWFGVDSNGQSMGLLLMHGASTSLLVSLFTVVSCVLLGIPLGACAGFFGGACDMVISRFMDILLAFPPLILPIAMMAFFGSGTVNVIIALSLSGWVSYARVMRGQFLAIKEREFVLASRSLGASSGRLMFFHILPNTLSPVAVQIAFSLASVILAEAGLSFLGLGVGQSRVSWGGLLNTARDHLTTHPFLAFFPAVALFSVVASLNFLGEYLRVMWDPKHRG